jgi:multisubunit Na+/H+ antiporter MnhC subunit
MAVYMLCAVLLSIGIWSVAVKQDVMKVIIGLVLMEYSMILFMVCLGARDEAAALAFAGLATTIITVSVAMRIYERYGTFDVKKINKLKG